MPYFLNLFQDGGALIEDQAASDRSLPLDLDERTATQLAALLGFESFELARACAELVMAGIRIAQRDSRRSAVQPGNS